VPGGHGRSAGTAYGGAPGWAIESHPRSGTGVEVLEGGGRVGTHRSPFGQELKLVVVLVVLEGVVLELVVLEGGGQSDSRRGLPTGKSQWSHDGIGSAALARAA
jgi:hypothetical protein